MLNRATLARPYARAAFAAARNASNQAGWSRALALASAVAHDEHAHRVMHDPRLGRDKVLELFSAVGGDAFDEAFGNFLRTLLHYDRLDLLPEITAQFEVLRAESCVATTSRRELWHTLRTAMRMILVANWTQMLRIYLDEEPLSP
jgi:F-type H+-transporting ATPase subunit delta